MKTKICAALAMTAIIGFSSISVYADDEIGDGCPWWGIDDSDNLELDLTIEYDDGRLLYVDYEDYNNHKTYCHDEDWNVLYLDADGNEHYVDLVEAEDTGTVYIDLDSYVYDSYGKSAYDSDGRYLFHIDYVDDNGDVHCHDSEYNIFYVDKNGYVHHQLIQEDTEDAADDESEDIGANGSDEPIAGNENEDTGTDTNKSEPAEPNPKTGNNGFPAAVAACALAAAALLKTKENLK